MTRIGEVSFGQLAPIALFCRLASMRFSIFHHILSVFLALVLLFGTVSKEFIHGFTGHQDTRSCLHAHDHGPVWDPPHHHCEFLSFVLSVFQSPGVWVGVCPPLASPFFYAARRGLVLLPSPEGIQPVRGPPQAGLS